MAGKDYLKGHASTSKAPGTDKDWLGAEAGPYIGIVKNNIDPLKMGRLQVNIPALSKTADPITSNLFTCEYLSPFYGAKDVQFNIPGSTKYEHSQHSYGFWAVPPDIGTRVLVIFAEGKFEQAFWIGCLQDPVTNHMVPGIAASEKTWDKSTGGPAGQYSSDIDKKNTYGTLKVPAGELNRNNPGINPGTNYESLNKPIHPLADILVKQGLSEDEIRGTTTSSARRETPSQVFGISTPGPKDRTSTSQSVGVKDRKKFDFVTRGVGHTFVMDDGDVNGNNQLTRLRTASGHQLLMHDTQGVVYIANASGNAYIEMQSNGRIDVYSGVGGINLRTEGDFNLHSDSNINMHANGQIRMSSAKEMIQSADVMLAIGDKAVLTSSPAGSIRTYGRDGISSDTTGSQLHGARGGSIHLAASGGGPAGRFGGQIHFNSTNPSDKWGPGGLTAESVGLNLRDEGDVELAQKGLKPLQEFTRKTKTTVHRLVTHEPMFRASVINNDGVIPIDADDKKQWYKNSNTPGTPEFINQKNRLSANSAIRDAQYQADALEYVKQKIGSSTNATKARELLTEFGLKYNEIYNITEKVNLPFDIKESITEKIKGIEFNSDVKDLTNTITSQVVEVFSGKSTELFKDNVFVNQTGELFSLARDASKTAIGGIDAANTALNTIDGLKGNLKSGDVIGTIGTLNSITQNYQSVVGGQIVGMNAVTKLATKAGLYNASAAQLGGQTFLQNIGQNISANIGSIAGSVKGFFTSRFSDMRLKEDIRFIGKSPSGINIYSFKYYQIPGRYIGVMAQEVPWATHMTDTGYLAVDYSKVDVEFRRLH